LSNLLLRRGVNASKRVVSAVVVDSATLGLGAHYMNLPSGPSYASTPSSSAMAPGSATVDLRAKIRMTDWTPAGNQFVLAKWNSGPDTQYGMHVDSAGKVNGTFYRAGAVFTGAASSVATGITDATDRWIRTVLNPTAGTIDYYTSADASSWTALGTQQAPGAGAVQTPGTPQPLTAGSLGSGGGTLIGRIYAVHLLIGGATVAAVDFSTQAAAATSFAGLTAETWTIQGSATII
jgi:hypothetical protein